MACNATINIVSDITLVKNMTHCQKMLEKINKSIVVVFQNCMKHCCQLSIRNMEVEVRYYYCKRLWFNDMTLDQFPC